MKYKLFRKDFEIWKNEIFFLPTVKIVINNMIYAEQNFSIEFHFLVFHARLLFLKKKKVEQMDNKVACKINETQRCEFDGTWLCKNPDCKIPVLTSTLYGAHPSGCPLVDKWNSRSQEEGGVNA